MRLLILMLIAGALLAQAPEAPSNKAPEAPAAPKAPEGPAVPKRVGNMKELMVDLIFPVSNEIFYVSRNEQKTEKDWIDLKMNSLALGEIANMLMSPLWSRDNDRWAKDAKLLLDVGQAAYKFSKEKNLKGLEDLNNDLYEACQSCHEHYRPGYKRRL